MVEDILSGFLLLGIAAITLMFRGEGQSVVLALKSSSQIVRSLVHAARSGLLTSNPLLKITGMLIVVVATGWASTLTRVGFDEAQRAIDFERPATKTNRYCHIEQALASVNMEMDAEFYNIKLKAGPLDNRLNYKCPHGGIYSLDDTGLLHCSIHGTAQGIPTVRLKAQGPKQP